MKYERKKQIISEVHNLPIEKVAGRYLELTKKGRYFLALCPFHADNRLGSFVITPDKNRFKCFSCGHGGSAVDLVMQLKGCGYMDAVLKIAADFQIISDAELKRLSGRAWDEKEIGQIRKEMEAAKEPPAKRAGADVIHKVLCAFARCCPLTDAHRERLIKERGLKDLGDFFSFPDPGKVDTVSRLLTELRRTESLKKYGKTYSSLSGEGKRNIDKTVKEIKEQIPYVPGFFKDAEGRIRYVSFIGMGFLVRGPEGSVRGIQVRRDECGEAEGRYVWFSSTFAQSVEGLEGGASSGAPGGVVYPKSGGQTPPRVCITEGRFKAEALARLGNAAVYVSGVSTWRNVLDDVDAVRKRTGAGRAVEIVFDADVMVNMGVYRQLSQLGDALTARGCPCGVVLWNPANGKGFDDFIMNIGHSRRTDNETFVRRFRLDAFRRIYDRCAEEAQKTSGGDPSLFKQALLKNCLEKFRLEALLPGPEQGTAARKPKYSIKNRKKEKDEKKRSRTASCF